MRYHRNSPRHSIPVKPVNAAAGLGSSINRDYVVTLLSNASRAEIEAVLHQAGYKSFPTDGPRSPSAPKPGANVDHEAAAFLRTPEGARLRTQRIEEMLKQSLKEWFAGVEGQRQVAEAKAALMAITLPKDPDLFTRACKSALDAQVAKWLQSPLGAARLEEEKERAVKQLVKGTEKPKVGWTQRQVEGMKDA